MSLTESIAQAIAQMEGFNTSGTIAQRQNNPGNLRSWGNYPVVGGYVQFPDPQTGWDALYSQVDKNIGRGLTIEEFFAGKPGVYDGFAPSADANKPAVYASYVATQTGVPTNVPLNALNANGPPWQPPKAQTPGGSI